MGAVTSGSWQKGHVSTHDLSAAGRKGKANSPWRHGCTWLGCMGSADERVRTAAKREKIARERYPGALKRPAINLAQDP